LDVGATVLAGAFNTAEAGFPGGADVLSLFCKGGLGVISINSTLCTSFDVRHGGQTANHKTKAAAPNAGTSHRKRQWNPLARSGFAAGSL
jgi:hypothetical protein